MTARNLKDAGVAVSGRIIHNPKNGSLSRHGSRRSCYHFRSARNFRGSGNTIGQLICTAKWKESRFFCLLHVSFACHVGVERKVHGPRKRESLTSVVYCNALFFQSRVVSTRLESPRIVSPQRFRFVVLFRDDIFISEQRTSSRKSKIDAGRF